MRVIRVRRRGWTPERHRQLVEPRQILQVFQAENLQKRRRGAVEQWAAEAFAARDDFDEAALHQLVHHGARIDTADLVHFQASDGLSVRDDRQRLQRGGRQPARPQRELRALDRLGILAPREELPSLRDLNQFDAVVLLIVLAYLVERGSDIPLRRREGLELLQRQGSRRRKQRGFKQLRERFHA